MGTSETLASVTGRDAAAMTITQVAAYACIAPTAALVSSFGARRERGALLLRLSDDQGHHGWGEIWCGMPASGALHRLALLREFLAPLLAGARIASIGPQMATLTQALTPVATLAGEPGPVAQVLAGVDSALWDLQAQRLGLPLYQLLGGQTSQMPCYASGLAPDISPAALDGLRAQGFTAFKFKAGFDDARTLPQLAEQYARLQRGERMMIDANCGWSLGQALAAVTRLQDLDLEWIEEPIPPGRPAQEWHTLGAASRVALAGGENLLSTEAFVSAFDWLGVVQPDVAKWGGVSDVTALSKAIRQAGRRFCPHSFGTQVAAMTSAHVLAAAGGDGYLELDANANPLRSSACYAGYLSGGMLHLPETPGIGIAVDPASLRAFVRDQFVVHAA